MSNDSKLWILIMILLFVMLPVVAGILGPFLKKMGFVDF